MITEEEYQTKRPQIIASRLCLDHEAIAWRTRQRQFRELAHPPRVDNAATGTLGNSSPLTTLKAEIEKMLERGRLRPVATNPVQARGRSGYWREGKRRVLLSNNRPSLTELSLLIRK